MTGIPPRPLKWAGHADPQLLAEFPRHLLFLVPIAVGSAVAGIKTGGGVIAVAIAFGFVLIMVAYAFGPVRRAREPCRHPRDGVGARKQPVGEAVGYRIARSSAPSSARAF